MNVFLDTNVVKAFNSDIMLEKVDALCQLLDVLAYN